MKKLLLIALVCAVAGLGLMSCGKQAGTENTPGHEHPKSEHPK